MNGGKNKSAAFLLPFPSHPPETGGYGGGGSLSLVIIPGVCVRHIGGKSSCSSGIIID